MHRRFAKPIMDVSKLNICYRYLHILLKYLQLMRLAILFDIFYTLETRNENLIPYYTLWSYRIFVFSQLWNVTKEPCEVTVNRYDSKFFVFSKPSYEY